MPLLIDGHNLIPKVSGLSLHAPDDEMRLIQLLQRYCAHHHTRAEVYFDRAAPGQAGRRGFGAVTAVFVHAGRTADQALAARLRALGRQAANWTVVSSDHEVQRAARWARAKVRSSEDFARELHALLSAHLPAAEKPASPSEHEIEEWLKLFGEG